MLGYLTATNQSSRDISSNASVSVISYGDETRLTANGTDVEGATVVTGDISVKPGETATSGVTANVSAVPDEVREGFSGDLQLRIEFGEGVGVLEREQQHRWFGDEEDWRDRGEDEEAGDRGFGRGEKRDKREYHESGGEGGDMRDRSRWNNDDDEDGEDDFGRQFVFVNRSFGDFSEQVDRLVESLSVLTRDNRADASIRVSVSRRGIDIRTSGYIDAEQERLIDELEQLLEDSSAHRGVIVVRKKMIWSKFESTVNASSIRVNGKDIVERVGRLHDRDRDGLPELQVSVDASDLNISTDNEEVMVSGKLDDSTLFRGSIVVAVEERMRRRHGDRGVGRDAKSWLGMLGRIVDWRWW